MSIEQYDINVNTYELAQHVNYMTKKTEKKTYLQTHITLYTINNTKKKL